MKNHRNHARHLVSLILAFAGLMSGVTLMPGLARLASAQVGASSWSYTGNLNTARVDHTATLLPNGKVLVAGGYDKDFKNGLNSAELYDPATGRWSITGKLNTAGSGTATLLPNGKVLVTRGLNSPELYDPATGTWSITGLYFHSGAEQPKACFAYIRKGRGIVMRHRPKEKNFFLFFGVPLLTR